MLSRTRQLKYKPAKTNQRKPATTSLGAGVWLARLDKALTQAKEAHSLVLANFSNSDFCPWCKKLKTEILRTKAFKVWAVGKVVLVDLDYLSPKVRSDETAAGEKGLMKKYGIVGLPTVLLITHKGKKIGKLGYLPGGAKSWIARVDRQFKKASQ